VGSLWLKIKVWAKLLLFAALVIYVITFIAKNIEPQVQLWVWYFEPRLDISVLLLVLVTFLIGVIGTVLSRTTFATLRQLREIRQRSRSERLEREVEEMRTKAAMLRSRPGAEDSAGAADEHAVP
jgi:hypothetical protein